MGLLNSHLGLILDALINILCHIMVLWELRSRPPSSVQYLMGLPGKNKGNLSLNDCLEKGSNLNPHIFDILLRFRNHFMGIIENAFHQIVINKPDKDYVPEVVWIDVITKVEPKIVEHCCARLVFRLTPSLTILNGIIQSHLTCFLLTEPFISNLLMDGFYVDNFASGARSLEEGFEIY